MKLSIVIPAYNEEARLTPMLEAYTRYFIDQYEKDVEFIVVVNGSVDATEEIAHSFSRRHPQVCTLVEPRAIGKGGAIMLGFKKACGELIGFVDADGSTPPEAFDDLVQHMGEAEAVIASRWRRESVVNPPQPLSRRVASRLFNWLVRTLFKLRISDTQCGAKLIRGEALRVVIPRLGLTRWAFDVDLLFQLRRAGYRIVELATTWHDVTGSRLNVPRASGEMFLAICRLRLLHSSFRWIVTCYDKTIGRFIRIKS